MKAVLIGGVRSSEQVLRGLVRNGIEVIGVLAHVPKSPEAVSGYVDLRGLANELSLSDVESFQRVNDPAVLATVQRWGPDVLFVVGLSQLVGEGLLRVAHFGSVGFHPTPLPIGRGRAGLAWLILEEQNGAATFFELAAEADSGGIFAQYDFPVLENDHVKDVYDRMLTAIDQALDDWLPELANGVWQPVPQVEAAATIWGKRTPEDGFIDWTLAADFVDRLIRASSSPYPGAYCYGDGCKVLVPRSDGVRASRSKGVPGRVLEASSAGYLVQCGSGAVHVPAFVGSNGVATHFGVGTLLNYRVQDEINLLRARLMMLEARLNALEKGDSANA